MATVLIGAVVNIVLDPILIFNFGMGVKGAALATITAQGVSAVWVVCFLLGKRTKLRLQRRFARLNWKVLAPVLALGVSPFIMQS
ncbi:polysaccharide biosynthesis C-terminal domain-containing protein, partial [Pseudomonas syringae pv. tagetis]